MYKLIIVDDEPTVLKFLHYVVNTYTLPFYICGEGENGEQALELVKKHQPEFVIIDIQMPLMDGLTVAEHIKKNYPLTKVYILTAHEHFDYAQRALRTHVDDYLLKPLKPEQLVEVLKKGIEDMLHQRINDHKLEKMERQVEQIKPVVKGKLVNDLITYGKIPLEKFTVICQMLDLLKVEPFGVFVISLENEGRETFCGSEANKFFAGELADRLGSCIYDILPGGEIVVLLQNNGIASSKQEVKKLTERLVREFALHIYTGLSFVSGQDIPAAFQEADHLRRTSLFWGQEGVFWDERGMKTAITIPDLDDIGKKIFNHLLERKFDKAKEIVKKMLEGMEGGSIEQVISICNRLGAILLYLFAEQIITGDEAVAMQKKYEAGLEKMQRYSQLQQVLLVFLRGFHEKLDALGDTQAEMAVKWAVRYINQNYSEEITLEKMAEKLFLSSCYFSRIFKKYAGEGFASFLIRIRIEQADKLLRTGKYSVAQVAKIVGFHDPGYFSNVFKKYQNISPNQVYVIQNEQESS